MHILLTIHHKIIFSKHLHSAIGLSSVFSCISSVILEVRVVCVETSTEFKLASSACHHSKLLCSSLQTPYSAIPCLHPSHLSATALALDSLLCLLCPMLKLGSQSGLFLSSGDARFPEIKCLEHILSFSVYKSALLIAGIKPVCRFRVSSSMSLPLFVITLGIL